VILGPSLLRCACACSERSRAWLPADPVPTHSHRQGRRSVDGERLASVQHNSQGQGRRKVWTGSAWQACSTTAKGAAPPPQRAKTGLCVCRPHACAGQGKRIAGIFRVHEQGTGSAWPTRPCGRKEVQCQNVQGARAGCMLSLARMALVTGIHPRGVRAHVHMALRAGGTLPGGQDQVS